MCLSRTSDLKPRLWIPSGIEGFASILTLEQQGIFALGFYHQRAYDRAQIQAAIERKKAGIASPEESDISTIAE